MKDVLKSWIFWIWMVFIAVGIYRYNCPDYRVTYYEGKYRVEDKFLGTYMGSIHDARYDTYEQAVKEIERLKIRDAKWDAERAEPWEPVDGSVDE